MAESSEPVPWDVVITNREMRLGAPESRICSVQCCEAAIDWTSLLVAGCSSHATGSRYFGDFFGSK